MTDRAKKAINQLMHVCRNTTYQDTLEALKDELRRCRAETLRETLAIILDAQSWPTVALELRRMAEEAEQEAENGR
jgi:hypothetical protein